MDIVELESLVVESMREMERSRGKKKKEKKKGDRH